MKFLPQSPDFAAEVRSENDYGAGAERELAQKRVDYFAAGTKVVWDVDLQSENVVRVYDAGRRVVRVIDKLARKLMPSTLASTGFTPAAFDAFLASRNEPGWLSDIRRAAWGRFQDVPMPARNDEEWSRTDIRLFKLDRYRLPDALPTPTETPSGLLSQSVALGGQTTTVDSAAAESTVSDRWAAKGVLFGAIEKLVAEHGDLLRPFFERRVVDPMRDKFAALNAACWAGGALLYVPKRVVVDEPFHALSGLTDRGVDLTKTLVILDEGAEATMLSETASIGPHAGGFHCGSIELIVEPGARLRYVNLQNWGDLVWHFAHQKAHVAARGTLQWTIGALGPRRAMDNPHAALPGDNAEAQVNGVMFTQGRQHLAYHTHQHHQAPHCHSDLLYKAALQDESRTVWRGMKSTATRRRPTLTSETTTSCSPARRGPIRSRDWRSRPTTSVARTAAPAAGSTSSRYFTR
jgi:Fe-S cluster assembly protein SufD